MEKLKDDTVQNTQKRGKHAKENNNVNQKEKPNLANSVEKSNLKRRNKKENKKLEKVLTIIIVILAVVTFTLDIYYIYIKLIPKFKDVTIEIGTEKELKIENFITKEKYIVDSKVITDLSQIDLNKVRRI